MKLKALLIAGLTVLLAGCEVLLFGNVIVGCAMRPDPEIMPKALPAATVGVPYRVLNASTPLSKLLVAPDKPLPEGLELTHMEREKQGVIQGAPTTAGSYHVLVYGSTYGTQCAGQPVERLYQLDVQS
ncbi:hypothetical protein [Aquipseudomonas guryensis]|jgi:hypothetical protein|uniref:Lipoprotein n=1 Tax=Aquipseudomonas guryensis TaxID=2759165 RepID=A0A7W4DAI4_9GAMM|nr:hypothetical protein [Pseudomonas guryensis]MBB1519034.1 hypothetical protein [Pseudomonas guryensis]